MTRLRKSLLLVLVFLGIFQLARAGLWLIYAGDFSSLDAGEVAIAFLRGLRFDLSITLIFLLVPLLLLNLPVAFARRRGWLALWGWICFPVLIAFVLILGGDLSYYAYVHRHVAEELWLLSNDLDFLLEVTVVQYWHLLLATTIGLVGLGLVWRMILRRPERPGRRPWIGFAGLLVLGALGIRGTLAEKPLTSVDAFSSQSFPAGNLSLNGVYTTLRSYIRDEAEAHSVALSMAEALATLGLDPASPYPVVRENPGRKPTGRNIVLFLMESWDTRYCDPYLSDGSGITPEFAKLCAEGRLFTNFYSSSQRSIGAVQAALLGVPCVPGLPELGYGLELSNVTRLGELARAHGYRTFFLQAGKRRSFYLDAIARSLGFDEAFGMEDVPEILDYGKEDARFGWDHETYQFALDRMDRLGGPFLVVTFSGTNHTPYPDPGERFHVGPHQRKGENGYRNCLHYSDWALGEFMRGARAKSWFANTLFLFSADHPWRTSGSDDLREWFRIPFLMLGSGVEPGVDKTVGSQVDLLPTMLEALGFPEPFSALGRSLLSGEAAPVLVKKGVVVGMISDGAWLQHSLRERLGQGWFGPGAPPAGVFETLERRLLAVSRVTYDLITSNRWAR